jgi:hypothetical protein
MLVIRDASFQVFTRIQAFIDQNQFGHILKCFIICYVILSGFLPVSTSISDNQGNQQFTK